PCRGVSPPQLRPVQKPGSSKDSAGSRCGKTATWAPLRDLHGVSGGGPIQQARVVGRAFSMRRRRCRPEVLWEWAHGDRTPALEDLPGRPPGTTIVAGG